MTIQATYYGEVRVTRSSYTSKNGPTLTLALHDIDELNKVQGMDGKRYMLALVEIGDDEQPVQKPVQAGGYAAKWLAIRCREAAFQSWLRPVYDRLLGGDGTGWGDVTPEHDFGGSVEKWAKHAVLVLCDCQESRSEIDHDTRKKALFDSKIRLPYMKWAAISGRASAPEWMEVA